MKPENVGRQLLLLLRNNLRHHSNTTTGRVTRRWRDGNNSAVDVEVSAVNGWVSIYLVGDGLSVFLINNSSGFMLRGQRRLAPGVWETLSPAYCLKVIRGELKKHFPAYAVVREEWTKPLVVK